MVHKLHFPRSLVLLFGVFSLFFLLAAFPRDLHAARIDLDYSSLEAGGSVGTYDNGQVFGRCDANLAPNVETKILFGGFAPAAGSCAGSCMLGVNCTSRAFLQWDVSSIPDGVAIIAVGLRVETYYPFSLNHYVKIKEMDVDSNSWGDDDQGFYEYIGNETTVYRNETNMFYSVGTDMVYLGHRAAADLQDSLDQDWFGLYLMSPGGEAADDSVRFYYTVQMDDELRSRPLSRFSLRNHNVRNHNVAAPGDGSDVKLVVIYTDQSNGPVEGEIF